MVTKLKTTGCLVIAAVIIGAAGMARAQTGDAALYAVRRIAPLLKRVHTGKP